ncbi:MAG: response regulator [Shimia sp.]
MRILIAEDELLIALDAEMALEDAGHEVVGTAVTEDEAVEMALAMRPDLMVVDLRLAGGSSGHRAVERVRAKLDVAVIFASGNLDPKTRAILAELMPVTTLSKPYGSAELVREVATASNTLMAR